MRGSGRAALAVLVACAVAGCRGPTDEERAKERAQARAASVHTQRMELGARVFDEHCHSCHGLFGRKGTGTTGDPGPSFDEVQPERAYVRQRVLDGGIGMQSFQGELSEAEIAAVVTYVTEAAGRNVEGSPETLSPSDRVLGERVYRETCQACHTLAGKPSTGPGVEQGIDFDVVKPSAAFTRRIVIHGNIFMPSQRAKLSDAEIEAVANYVAALAREKP